MVPTVVREHLGILAKQAFPVVYKRTSVKLILKSILALARIVQTVVHEHLGVSTKWVFLVVNKQTINDK